jgi:hypothetical protein
MNQLPSKPPEYDAGNLSGPIPGMSLTSEQGNRPWENPPQIVTVEDAIEFYSEKLLDPEKQDMVIETLELDISVESIADMLTTSAVMDGIHTIDISVLVTPVIQEMVRYVADTNGISYVDSHEAKEKEQRISKRELRNIVKEVAADMNKDNVPKLPGMGAIAEEEPIQEAPAARGLMARKPKPMMEE